MFVGGNEFASHIKFIVSFIDKRITDNVLWEAICCATMKFIRALDNNDRKKI